MRTESHDIEQDIEIERGLLDRAIGQLSEAVSSEALAESVSSAVRDKSGTLGQVAVDAVRANPAGAIVFGVGIAALLAGPKRPTESDQNNDRRQTKLVEDTLHRDSDRSAAGADADHPRDAKPNANRMKAALNSGLANLPEPARLKVITAREAAIAVQEQMDEQAIHAARKAKRLHKTQPLLTAALAAGVGAVIGAVLPRTRLEDETLGAKRDALLQQAELVLYDEIARIANDGQANQKDEREANR